MNNNYIPTEVKNLSESKQRVMKNVMRELEKPSKTAKPKWRYVVISSVLTLSAMLFVFNVISFEKEQNTATPNTEQLPPTHSDLIPTFSNEGGNLQLNELTLGGSQEDVIQHFGEDYTIQQEDGSGADLVMDYEGTARFYFFEGKLFQVILMKVDKGYFDQLFNDYDGFKFTSSSSAEDNDRFIYSKETNQVLKATTNVPNNDLYIYLSYAGPEILENPEFLKMEQSLE